MSKRSMLPIAVLVVLIGFLARSWLLSFVPAVNAMGQAGACVSGHQGTMDEQPVFFRTVALDLRGYERWQMGDGLVSPWREGDRLYLFAGRFVHVMDLPVRERRDDPQPRSEGGL